MGQCTVAISVCKLSERGLRQVPKGPGPASLNREAGWKDFRLPSHLVPQPGFAAEPLSCSPQSVLACLYPLQGALF